MLYDVCIDQMSLTTRYLRELTVELVRRVGLREQVVGITLIFEESVPRRGKTVKGLSY